MNITEISLKRPITTFMVFVCFIVIGLIATRLLPVAFLPEQIFEFEPVIEGDIVIHDFIIQNKGTAPLVIHKVRAG